MKSSRLYPVAFTALVIMFFIPSVPGIAKSMVDTWSFTLTVYWILLTVVAIALGFKAVKGVEM